MGARRPAIGYVERGAGVQRPGPDPRNGSCPPVSRGLIQQGPPRERDFDPGADRGRPADRGRSGPPDRGRATLSIRINRTKLPVMQVLRA